MLSFVAFEASSAVFPMCWVKNQLKIFLLGMTRFTTMRTHHFVIATLSAYIFLLCYIKYIIYLIIIFTFINHQCNHQSIYHNIKSLNYPGFWFVIKVTQFIFNHQLPLFILLAHIIHGMHCKLFFCPLKANANILNYVVQMNQISEPIICLNLGILPFSTFQLLT